MANIVAPWEVHKDYIITDVTEKVLQQIMDKGYRVEVLFEKPGGVHELLFLWQTAAPGGTRGLVSLLW